MSDKRGCRFLLAIDSQGHQGVGRIHFADFYQDRNQQVPDQMLRHGYDNEIG